MNQHATAMTIYGNIDKRNVDPAVEPLFQAMLAGQTIKSITIMKGQMNKHDPSQDKTIENVTATNYWQGSGSSHDKETGRDVWVDYVEAEPQNFYMSWVRSFTLE